MKFALNPGIQCAVDAKYVETSDNKPNDEHFIGNEIASIHVVVVEINVRHQMQTNRWTDGFSALYM